MGWGSIFWRRVKVFALAIVIYLDYKKLQLREKWIKNSKQDDLWEKAHERNSRRVLNLIVDLEGLWVKLGQYLSIRADVLPPAYIQLLKKLQETPPPCPKEEVFQTVTRELGKSIEELFMNFDDIPLATASIAQVHRATLHDGQEVVVKVQHEGIEEIILEDLEIAKSIVDWIAWAEPQYNFNPMIDEWFKEAPKELNFNHEAENTRKVSKTLGCRSNYDGDIIDCADVLIPEVIMSSKKVLILEYIDGVRLNDSESLQALGVDKQKLVEEITRAYAHQIYVDGFFNRDPHPGNFLVSKVSPHRPVLLNFGLTKRLPSSAKQALAKMFLASIEGDFVALLSSFTEMGLKLRLNIPEQVTKAANMFFGTSTPAHEAPVRGKQVQRFNPVDAFPGDIITFSGVINLLKGLSSTMDLHVNIMRPFAESVLQCNVKRGPTFNANWIHDSPPLSYVEDKVRKLLIQLRDADKVLGIQVCVYKDGEVIVDTAAGMLGRYDPRPVQPNSLFPVFSASKGITAGMVHWLVDKGMLDYEDKVENIWPKFGSNGKGKIKVHHVLNHTTGMHNALASVTRDNPLLMTEWDECLHLITETAPETEPGCQYLYHYLSFGWLCGGIIEHASGKRFQEILEEAFVRPLNIDGELYIGIPPGVESRLATLTSDRIDMAKIAGIVESEDLPSTLQVQDLYQMAYTLPVFCNTLSARRSIIPAANAHCSARALARYYAALVDQGAVPPPHSSSAQPLLGSHPHIPKFSSPQNAPKKQKNSEHAPNAGSKAGYENYIVAKGGAQTLFTNRRIHDALMGVGDYEKLTLTGGQCGLGFRRGYSKDGELIGFGHAGMGGATGYCDINNRFAIAVTLNKMNLGDVTAKVMQLVCSELNIPLSTDYCIFGEEVTDNESNVAIPLIK